MDKITYVFDVDGTVCTQTDGNYEDAQPFKERIEKINELYDAGNTIVFLTARGMGRFNNNRALAESKFWAFTNQQLKSWGLKFHSLFLGKPPATIYVDDKGMRDKDFFND